MGEDQVREIWRRWVDAYSDLFEKTRTIPDLLIEDIKKLYAAEREHRKASKVLLETHSPVMPELPDIAVQRRGFEHDYLLQGVDYLGMIETLLGREAKQEAVLHVLQDWGIMTAEDVEITQDILGGPPKRKSRSRPLP